MSSRRRIPFFAMFAALGLAPCCTTPVGPQETIWPPADFYLEVRLGNGQKVRARARFWADGFAVCSEAAAWLGGPASRTAPLPVFSRVSAYRMRRKSVRELARLVDRAGLVGLGPDQAGRIDSVSTIVTVHWRSFGREATVWATTPIDSAMVRVLHVVNSFLPEGSTFHQLGLMGEPEPRHLLFVPELRDSAGVALEFYLQTLVPRDPTDTTTLTDAFILALAVGKHDVAARLLADIEAVSDGQSTEAWWLLPGSGSADLKAQLGRLLAADPPPAAVDPGAAATIPRK